ncbi:hypothetical protein IV203_006933 [Nitzschia inconspicua]|uniref:Uncharacterized protein n=1 Tax=Nitzschia inconspicua TaxID=303405 RepID=A0A9K3KED7_9STRA|nr:hypothetical protein IV203_006933 [Nitzschia inconspicua]
MSMGIGSSADGNLSKARVHSCVVDDWVRRCQGRNKHHKAVDKSKRRLKERERENAREQERNVKWAEMPTAQHLTEYCLMKAKEEWDVSTSLIAMYAKIDPGDCRSMEEFFET